MSYRACLAAALVVLTSITCVGRVCAENPEKPPIDQAALAKTLDDMKNIVIGLQATENTNSETLRNLAQSVKDLKSQADEVDKLRKEVSGLKSEMELLRQLVHASGSRPVLPLVNSGQRASPGPDFIDQAKPVMGYIHLQNRYFRDVTILVNGRAFRLAQGQTLITDVPAGSFTYEILGVPGEEGERQREVKPNRFFNVFAYE